jgi:CBS domain-containing protein
MPTVNNIFKRKGTQSITISPQASVLEALKIMSERNIGSMIVMEDGKYLGLMTERDYARKVILLGKASVDTLVGDIMSIHLPIVLPESQLEDCMTLMTQHNVRYLPVFSKGEFVGIISIMDVVKETISQQQQRIEDLQQYLHSAR